MLTRFYAVAAVVVTAAAIGLALIVVATAGSVDDGFVNSTCPTAPGDLGNCA